MSENMLFCLGEGSSESKGAGYQKSYHVFNQQLTKDEWNKVKSELPNIELPINKWIDGKDMTNKEKDNNSIHKEIGGFLRRLNYEDAWKNWWNNAIQSDKNKILDCEYFDAEIFKGITGLEVTKEKSLVGSEAIVEVGGKKYKAKIVSEE